MIFNSYAFLFFFLPVVWILHRIAGALKWPRVAICVLVLGSLFFYGFWNPPYLALILFSIIFNFSVGRVISKFKGQKLWPLVIGLIVNLGFIGYFKYTNFVVDNLAAVFDQKWNVATIVLPLGISFFTFQQIAYLVDCHKGLIKKHGVLEYALFISYFPQLVAGPIVHHGDMLHQFRNSKFIQFNMNNIAAGSTIFILGLFKKVIIADSLSPIVSALFDVNTVPGFFDSWLGSLAYTFQIYFDFSGYSDMAIGLGKMFNVELPVNFNSPYKATSIIDFWRRWHITLSRFLRDYLYIPLGGNRKGTPRRYVNLMLTMLLGGLWHGAAWTFVIWGGLHGILLCINHGWNALSKKISFSFAPWFSWILTFLSVNVAWVFFRATSFERAFAIIKGMTGLNDKQYLWEKLLDFNTDNRIWSIFIDKQLLFVTILMVIVLTLPTAWKWGQTAVQSRSLLAAVALGGMFVITVLSMTKVSEFLYFQF